MTGEVRGRSKRLAALFVVGGLVLLSIGVLYLLYLSQERALAEPWRPSPSPQQRLLAATSVLTFTAIAAIVFLVGSLLMVRAGRLLVARRAARNRTPYVDAWGAYRISQEQIAAATGDRSDSPPGPPPDDREDDPPTPKD